MKQLNSIKHIDHLNTVYYNILQNDKDVVFLEIKTLEKSIIDKAPFQSATSIKKYKKMTDKDLTTFIINFFMTK